MEQGLTCLNFLFYFVFVVLSNEIQGLVHARQALYH